MMPQTHSIVGKEGSQLTEVLEQVKNYKDKKGIKRCFDYLNDLDDDIQELEEDLDQEHSYRNTLKEIYKNTKKHNEQLAAKTEIYINNNEKIKANIEKQENLDKQIMIYELSRKLSFMEKTHSGVNSSS